MKIKGTAFMFLVAFMSVILCFSCSEPTNNDSSNEKPQEEQAEKSTSPSPDDILGNPDYLAMSYGGYREITRDSQPSIEQLKEDMKILSAMGIRILRTYNVHLAQASNLLEAIHQLKQEDPKFEMYLMLGAWINCKDGWTDKPDHEDENLEDNTLEIQTAVELTNKYPDIVKVIAVGNEAMVHWAQTYFVRPNVILKWVNHLQDLKQTGKLPKDVWITSSDNFAAWGGGDPIYHTEDLTKLINAVDYISLHVYPMHETHYNPQFWGVFDGEENLSKTEKIEKAMTRALGFAIEQYDSTAGYLKKLGIEKQIHIGETGWASTSNGFYGDGGTKATDEYKEGMYYNLMREWTAKMGMACFYFEAFDEIWKDEKNPGGSENHFGLFTLDGTAKYPMWDLVDKGVFEGLTRAGNSIGKTYNGDIESLLNEVKLPPSKSGPAWEH